MARGRVTGPFFEGEYHLGSALEEEFTETRVRTFSGKIPVRTLPVGSFRGDGPDVAAVYNACKKLWKDDDDIMMGFEKIKYKPLAIANGLYLCFVATHKRGQIGGGGEELAAHNAKVKNRMWTKDCEAILYNGTAALEHIAATNSHKAYVQSCASALYQREMYTDPVFAKHIAEHDLPKYSTVEIIGYGCMQGFQMDVGRAKTGAAVVPGTGSEDQKKQIYDWCFKTAIHHHYKKCPHHIEHLNWGSDGSGMSEIAIREAVVDGLACVLERTDFKDDAPPSEWLSKYFVGKHKGKAGELAKELLSEATRNLTDSVWKSLLSMKKAFNIIYGVSPGWSFFATPPPYPGEQSSARSKPGQAIPIKYKCDICGKTFDTSRGLSIHKGKMHK